MEKIDVSKTDHAADLRSFAAKLTALDTDLEGLAKAREIKRIIELIKIRRGWTTPAELSFANSIADSISLQLKTVQNVLKNFAAGADLVKESI